MGYVASPELFQGNMKVSEQDIELVKKGQKVRVFVPFDEEFVVATVTHISPENQSESETSPVDPSDNQSSTFYDVQFQFSADRRVRIGSARKAVILCRETTGLDWATRWLYHSFWL